MSRAMAPAAAASVLRFLPQCRMYSASFSSSSAPQSRLLRPGMLTGSRRTRTNLGLLLGHTRFIHGSRISTSAKTALNDDPEFRSVSEELRGKDSDIDALTRSLLQQKKKNRTMQRQPPVNGKGDGGSTPALKGGVKPRAVMVDEEDSDDLSDISGLSDLSDVNMSDISDSETDEDGSYEKELKVSEDNSEFDASMENGREVSDLSDVEDVLASNGKLMGSMTNIDPAMGGEVLEAWKKFAMVLRQKNYFRVPHEDAVKGEAAYLSFANILGALKRFAEERDDIIKTLPVDDLKVLAGYHCPTMMRKIVNAGKRLRGHCNIDEAGVCQLCPVKEDCGRAYLPPDTTASTSDALQYVFAFVSQATQGVDYPDNVRIALVNTLGQLTSLSSVSRDPSIPHEDAKWIKKPKQARPLNADYEMKPGDWKCTHCEYINFCRNRHCRECFTPRPPQQLLPGDWECQECRFVNFARNDSCHDCKAQRPDAVKVFHTVKGSKDKEKWEGSVQEYAKVADRLEKTAQRSKFSDGLEDSDDDVRSKPNSKRRAIPESDSDLGSDFDKDDFDFKAKSSLGKKQSAREAWDDDTEDDEDDFRSSRSRGGGSLRGRGFASRQSSGNEFVRGGRNFTSGGRGGRASLDDDDLDSSDEDLSKGSRGARGGAVRGGAFGGRGRGRGSSNYRSESDDLDDSEDDFPASRQGRGRGRGESLMRGRGRGRASYGDDESADDLDESDSDFPSRNSRGGRGAGGFTRGRGGRAGRGSFADDDSDIEDAGPRGSRGRASRFGRAKFAEESDDASDVDSDDFMSDESEDDNRMKRSSRGGRGGRGGSRYGDDDFSDESDDDDEFSNRGSRGSGRGRGRFGDFGGGRGGDRFGSRGGYGGRGGDFGGRDDFRGGRGGGFRGGRGGYGDRDDFRGGRGGFGDRDRDDSRGGRGGGFGGDRDDFRGGRGGGFGGDRDDFRGGRGDRDGYRGGRSGGFGDRDGGFRGGRGGGFGDRDGFRGGRGGYGRDRDDFRGGRGGYGGDRDDFGGGGRGGGGFRGRGRGGFRSQDY